MKTAKLLTILVLVAAIVLIGFSGAEAAKAKVVTAKETTAVYAHACCRFDISGGCRCSQECTEHSCDSINSQQSSQTFNFIIFVNHIGLVTRRCKDA